MKKFRKSRHARLAAVVLAVGVFASLAGVGYAAGVVPFVHTSPTAAQYPQSKVTICHHTHSKTNPSVTITVSVHALPAHLGHGDTVGPCASAGTTGATGATGPATPKVIAVGLAHKGKKGGKGHGSENAHAGGKNHGKSHGQGNGQRHAPVGPNDVRGNGHGNGHANGHSSTHGQGHGQGQGQGQGSGHGNHGQGHGPSQTHGHSGGNGHGH